MVGGALAGQPRPHSRTGDGLSARRRGRQAPRPTDAGGERGARGPGRAGRGAARPCAPATSVIPSERRSAAVEATAVHDQRGEPEPGQVAVGLARAGRRRGEHAVDAALVGQVHGAGEQRAADAAAALVGRDEQVRHVQHRGEVDRADLVRSGRPAGRPVAGRVVGRRRSACARLRRGSRAAAARDASTLGSCRARVR